MRIPNEDLESILTQFNGHKLEGPHSSFKSFSLQFFTNNVVPSYHLDISIDASVMLSIYNVYYKRPGSSFSAFTYYNLIQTMQKSNFDCFRYRFINDEWYYFENLPLFTSVKIADPLVQQVGFFIENVASLSWASFVDAYADGIRNARTLKTEQIVPSVSWYNVCHQMTTLPIVFSSYTPSQKDNDFNAHAPWFVISQRQETNFTLSVTASHASSLPSEMHAFLMTFKQRMCEVPEQQQITQYFK